MLEKQIKKTEKNKKNLKEQIYIKDQSIILLQILLFASKPDNMDSTPRTQQEEVPKVETAMKSKSPEFLYQAKEQSYPKLKSRKKELFGRVISAVLMIRLNGEKMTQQNENILSQSSLIALDIMAVDNQYLDEKGLKLFHRVDSGEITIDEAISEIKELARQLSKSEK